LRARESRSYVELRSGPVSANCNSPKYQTIVMYTDNLSAHGARVRATCAWQLGEHAEITPVSGEATVRGEVVYCQRLDNDRFFVGVKIRESHIPWSILRRFVAFR